jgi:DNA invertase Pin-like site-specific DNA recombinase
VTTRVAIYARVSTGEQSPEAQLRELRHYAEHRGFPITREYVDQASGDVRKRRRAPEFEALMADARRRRFDCVLVWKYDAELAKSVGAHPFF